MLLFQNDEVTEVNDIIPQDFVVLDGNQVLTDSRTVAIKFGKRHQDVMRTIRSLLRKLPEKARCNFALCHEINELRSGGRQLPFYQLTKDGFILVAMRYTTDAALAVQLAFLDAFNRMAEIIRAQSMGAWQAWNTAYLDYKHDAAAASGAGRYLNRWGRGGIKEGHMERLARLDPQLALPLHA